LAPRRYDAHGRLETKFLPASLARGFLTERFLKPQLFEKQVSDQPAKLGILDLQLADPGELPSTS
jgi:hypothetical protein